MKQRTVIYLIVVLFLVGQFTTTDTIETVAAAKTTESTINEAVATLRNHFKKRDTDFSVSATFTGDYDSVSKSKLESTIATYVNQIWKGAYMHTGVSDEGDYIRWQLGTSDLNVKYNLVGDNLRITVVGRDVTYYTNASQENLVSQKITQIINGLNISGKSDYQKAKVIYDYVTSHVIYDYDNVGNQEYTLQYSAYGALNNGKAVCQGYANLLYRMLLVAGVDNRIVVGTANNGVSAGAHAWNAVCIDGTYYFVDATWDAAYAGAGLPYEYFLKGSTSFSKTHTIEYGDQKMESAFASYPVATSNYSVSSSLTNTSTTTIVNSAATTTTNSNDIKGNLIYSVVVSYSKTGKSVFAVVTGVKKKDVKSVTIPATVVIGGVKYQVQRIEANAFYGMKNLKSLVIGKHVKTIGAYAFSNCKRLAKITVKGKKLKTIETSAFSNIKKKVKVIAPKSKKKAYKKLFKKALSGKEVTFKFK